jgi:hypothetical protein
MKPGINKDDPLKAFRFSKYDHSKIKYFKIIEIWWAKYSFDLQDGTFNMKDSCFWKRQVVRGIKQERFLAIITNQNLIGELLGGVVSIMSRWVERKCDNRFDFCTT